MEKTKQKKWAVIDDMTALYISCYGVEGLILPDIPSIAYAMDISEKSLIARTYNFNYLLGRQNKVLANFAKQSKEVFDLLIGSITKEPDFQLRFSTVINTHLKALIKNKKAKV